MGVVVTRRAVVRVSRGAVRWTAGSASGASCSGLSCRLLSTAGWFVQKPGSSSPDANLQSGVAQVTCSGAISVPPPIGLVAARQPTITTRVPSHTDCYFGYLPTNSSTVGPVWHHHGLGIETIETRTLFVHCGGHGSPRMYQTYNAKLPTWPLDYDMLCYLTLL